MFANNNGLERGRCSNFYAQLLCATSPGIDSGFDFFLHNLRRLVMLKDKFAQLRINNGAPAASRENAVVSAFFRREVTLVLLGNTGAQIVRGISLAVAGDVVEFAFDREERGLRDVLRLDPFTRNVPRTLGQT